MEPDRKMELENRIAMGPKFSSSFESELLGRRRDTSARTATAP